MKYNPFSQEISTFVIIWAGQTLSLIGSGLTGFALGLWVFQSTGSALQFALIAFSATIPRLLLSPLAGTVVDRWDRRRVMILSDTGAGVSTLIVAWLFFSGHLEIWHIYLATAVSAAFGTLQFPAYAALTTQLIPKKHLGRANGLVQFSQAATEILSPLLAGILILTIQVQGVILIDVVTFLIAVSLLFIVKTPGLPRHNAEHSSTPSIWHDMAVGWKYLISRPGLYGLLIFFAVVNFLWAMLGVLLPPMILSFASADVLGLIISVAGFGMLAGSLAMSGWGGPKRRVTGILSFEFISGLGFILMGLKPVAWLIAAGAFCAHVTIAIVAGCNQALWQSKVAPELQGRIFAFQQMLTKSATPIAILLAGFLADTLFEPMLAPGGFLAGTAGQLVETGPGRGMALMIVVMGIVKLGVSLAGWLNPRVRLIEDELPDAIGDTPG